MTMAEKILARHLVGAEGSHRAVAPGDAVVVTVDGGYSHEFTTAQVHAFLADEYGADYRIQDPQRFAVFEDHLIYADEVQAMRRYLPKIEILRDMQRRFQAHTGVRDFSAERRGLARHLPRGGARADGRARRLHPGDRLAHLHGRAPTTR